MMITVSSDDRFSILVLTGSDDDGSYNHALVDGARRTAPANVEIIGFDLRSVPPMTETRGHGRYRSGKNAEADGARGQRSLIVTPECGSEVPCVVKNGIDWISQTYPDAPIKESSPRSSPPRQVEAEHGSLKRSFARSWIEPEQ